MAKRCVRFKRTSGGRRCAKFSGYGKRKRRTYRGYGQSVMCPLDAEAGLAVSEYVCPLVDGHRAWFDPEFAHFALLGCCITRYQVIDVMTHCHVLVVFVPGGVGDAVSHGVIRYRLFSVLQGQQLMWLVRSTEIGGCNRI